ncbi:MULTISPECIES: hypothetical protein [Paraliobacillus]|uniref:hypothetical protein n=1 Tax=Paraliobacillus TaxID=200903 RepID=UPI000DD41151|nr:MULTISPECIES: hypothetical protein [Paraliobacillus]
MLSGIKETFSKGYTAFKLRYEEEVFYIKKPYMHKGNYCEIKDSKENIVATHMKQNLFSLKRNIQLEDHYSELQNGIYILTLSVIIFVA